MLELTLTDSNDTVGTRGNECGSWFLKMKNILATILIRIVPLPKARPIPPPVFFVVQKKTGGGIHFFRPL